MLPTKLPTKLLADTLPKTFNVVNVPTLVILGCAAVVTVPAVVAEVALIAFVALGTNPITLPPGIDESPLALPLNTPVLALMFIATIFH